MTDQMHGASDDQLIESYMKYRDYLDRIEEKRKNEDAPYVNAMARISEEMLRRLNERQSENSKTSHGTAYVSITMSMKTVNKNELQNYVVSEEAWDLVDWRPLKEGVKTFIDTHKTPPPGVETTWIRKVNFRKA